MSVACVPHVTCSCCVRRIDGIPARIKSQRDRDIIAAECHDFEVPVRNVFAVGRGTVQTALCRARISRRLRDERLYTFEFIAFLMGRDHSSIQAQVKGRRRDL